MGTIMGATQSELSEYEDEGPAVTKGRIAKAIKEHEKTDNVLLEQIEEKSGNVKGAGFMGALVQLKVTATVDGKLKHYSWMVKSTPREPNRHLIARKFKMDEREVTFFKVLLPKLKTFVDSKNCSDIFPNFCPVPFASWTPEDKVLIMENLSDTGWRDAIDKKKGLNIEDMLLKFRTIANNSLKDLFGTIEKLDPEKKYVKRLESVLDKHQDMNNAALSVREKQQYKLQTICHSDPWFNNMMFQYGPNNTVEQAMFIDFQIASYHSPTLDLAYFMTSSTTGEFRRQHLSHVLTYYHTIFMLTVQRLGSSVDYSFEDLESDYKKSYLWGLNFSVGALPSVLAESEEDVMDMETIMGAVNNRDKDASNEAITKEMDRSRALFNKNKALMDRLHDTLNECIDYEQL